MDRRQTDIPAARRVAAFAFQIIEEPQDEGRIQILNGQLGGTVFSDIAAHRQSAGEKCPDSSQSYRGLAARSCIEPLRKVGLQQFGKSELGFHFSPFSAHSQRRVARFNSSGTAERYQ